jgi:hypothetical protein
MSSGTTAWIALAILPASAAVISCVSPDRRAPIEAVGEGHVDAASRDAAAGALLDGTDSEQGPREANSSPDSYAVRRHGDRSGSLADWTGRWRIIRQGQCSHMSPGDCPRKGILTIRPHHLTYSGDSCDDNEMYSLKTDCAVEETDVHPPDPEDSRLSCYTDSLQRIVHQPIVTVVETSCPFLFDRLLVLRSGDLLTDSPAGNYYVLRKVR